MLCPVLLGKSKLWSLLGVGYHSMVCIPYCHQCWIVSRVLYGTGGCGSVTFPVVWSWASNLIFPSLQFPNLYNQASYLLWLLQGPDETTHVSYLAQFLAHSKSSTNVHWFIRLRLVSSGWEDRSVVSLYELWMFSNGNMSLFRSPPSLRAGAFNF